MYNKFESLPFTLTMLGTDTVYTPTLKKTPKAARTKGTRVKDYPKGETLSVISSLIQIETPEVANKDYAYQANEVVVINGPETYGTDVGKKIALGLAAALKAIARGQITINIIAHSRGAVESILIAHELQAIQGLVASCDSVQQLIKKLAEQQAQRHKGTPKNNTPDIIALLDTQINLIPKDSQAQWFSDLKTNIATANVNFFGIDPVPGDCRPITWYDERFFTLPKIIKNAQILYYENERTDWGFTPICPEVEAKEEQNFVRYSIPGHHGTGSSGNNASQPGFVVCENEVKTTHVQKIIIFKILNFLTAHGVTFKDGQEIFQKHSALGRKYAGVAEGPIDVTQLNFPVIYRELYAAIAKNRSAYEAYNTTNYRYMGLSSQRQTLRSGHVYGVFNSLFPRHSGYVNDEHAGLMRTYFFKIFGLDANPDSLAEMINTAHHVLEENIKKIIPGPNPILGEEKVRKDVLETFDKVVREVSSKYFTNDWSSVEKQQEKQALYQAIIAILAKFNELSNLDNPIIKQFVTELTAVGLSGIKLTIEHQYQDIEADFNRLQESTDKRLVNFFNGLLKQLKQTESESISDLEAIVSSADYPKGANHPYTAQITYIANQLAESKLNNYPTADLAERFAEQYPDNFHTFAKLHQQIQVFIMDLQALRRLTPNEKIDQIELSLHQKSNALIATATERFYKDRPHALPPIDMSDTFMEQAERYAISHYGMVDRRQEQIAQSTQQIDALTLEKKTITQQAQEQFAQLTQQIDTLTLEKKTSTQQAQEQIAQLTQQIEILTVENQTATQQAQEQLAQLEQQKQTLIEQLNQATQEKAIEEQARQNTQVKLNAAQEKATKNHQAMNDVVQARNLLLISEELEPITQAYLQSLQLSKTADPQKIRKIELVNELLACLHDTSNNPFPSARVHAFYQALDLAETELKVHRDPAWTRYVRNAVVIAGILISGILPGLLALTAYRQLGNSSLKSLSFWNTTGTNVYAALKATQPLQEESEIGAEEHGASPL